MSNIKFVSHEVFPDDMFTKELVYLCIEDKYRVAYVRKEAKSGGKFWTVVTQSVTRGSEKQYYESFLMDSSFLEKDIRSFLEQRSWEKPSQHSQQIAPVENHSEIDHDGFPF